MVVCGMIVCFFQTDYVLMRLCNSCTSTNPTILDPHAFDLCTWLFIK